MKKNKLIIFLLISISFSFCKKTENIGEIFIKDNFLKIVDTVAYKTGKFIFLPNYKKNENKNLAIYLNSDVSFNAKIEEITLNYFKKDTLINKNIIELVTFGKKNNLNLNDIFPKTVGKYDVYFEKETICNNKNYAGRIDIQNLKILKNYAMLVVTESFGKNSKTNVLIFVKNKDVWNLIKKDLLFIT